MDDRTLKPHALPASAAYLLAGGIVAASAGAWIVSLRAMGAMPATVAGFVAFWTVMMAAMMLPSELPAALLFATVARSRTRFGFPAAPTAAFLGGYLGVWMATGVGMALLQRAGWVTMHGWGQMLLGGALLAAGVYQLSRWKMACLSHCRAPKDFFMASWRDGPLGAVWMGAVHGLYCLGCCWGLMLALVALGLMNPLWMAVIALATLVEKTLPGGERFALLTGAAFALAGAGILLGWIPLPHHAGGM